MKTIIFSILTMLSFLSFSQEKIQGMVMEANPENKHIPLPGASVYWLDTQIGAMTDKDGLFALPYTPDYQKLVISYVGFKSDTLAITTPKDIHHWLQPAEGQLDEVVLEKEREALQKTYFQTQNIVTVNSAELLKAACCNLSESFETNPSIDVNFSDALTGTRQIRMLGLTSPYLMITQENIPMVRGASQAYGLTFTPGTWVESIQITKGAGSVVNGFESIAGQINAELQKPFSDYPLFVNAYANRNGRYELNTHLNKKLNDKWSTGLYLHGNTRTQKVDNNEDGFLDVPLAQQINILNRWQYQDVEKGWVSFLNFRYMNDEKQVGQEAFDPEDDKFTTNAWGSEIKTQRVDASAKLGYVFPETPYNSFGFQMSYSDHRQDSYFGFNRYDIDHRSVYSNLIFNSILGDTRHKYKTGLNFTHDGYVELVNASNFKRTENNIGAFFEYSFDNLDNFSLTAGLRIDHHNLLETFVTPRLHLRYVPWEKGVLRTSIGRGKRSANIFAENQQLFGSARQIDLQQNGGPVYGFNPEIAWNYGISFLQGFTLLEREGDITVDFYRTDFTDQVVVDWEDPRAISFYNLEGDSYANSLQIELNYSLTKRLELRSAYKYYDVKTEYQNAGKLQKPLQARHRVFGNLSYETIGKDNGARWKFDATYNWLGAQRLPDTSTNPVQFQLGTFSPSYSMLNAQVTKVFSKKFEVYVGGENLTNFKQENPVLGNEDPFGPNFDTSIVFAPILGDMYYAGLRFKL
ncbi:TonB-dependent receptor domain-containing protein [Sungkyunkwania multivorans]|uniref:TonB-dependent receptor domain-containing protein n=1 Tax=Sungkyunkwania multivorans TaxID=1173618 RepID=A0ABW3D0Y8_9FLAO